MVACWEVYTASTAARRTWLFEMPLSERWVPRPSLVASDSVHHQHRLRARGQARRRSSVCFASPTARKQNDSVRLAGVRGTQNPAGWLGGRQYPGPRRASPSRAPPPSWRSPSWRGRDTAAVAEVGLVTLNAPSLHRLRQQLLQFPGIGPDCTGRVGVPSCAQQRRRMVVDEVKSCASMRWAAPRC